MPAPNQTVTDGWELFGKNWTWHPFPHPREPDPCLCGVTKWHVRQISFKNHIAVSFKCTECSRLVNQTFKAASGILGFYHERFGTDVVRWQDLDIPEHLDYSHLTVDDVAAAVRRHWQVTDDGIEPVGLECHGLLSKYGAYKASWNDGKPHRFKNRWNVTLKCDCGKSYVYGVPIV